MWLKKLTVYSQGFHNKTKRLMRYSKLHVNMTMNIKVKAVKLTKEIGGAKAAKELGIPEEPSIHG